MTLKQRLQQRGQFFDGVRCFFAQRQVLAVDTPTLSHYATTDPALHSLQVSSHQARYFLPTSPEYFMKRLLAAGSGDIYQLSRAYRDDEQGRWHRPEFWLLEWYRVGWCWQQLLAEVAQLVNYLSHQPWPVETIAYGDLFSRHFALDSHATNAQQLQTIASQYPWYVDCGDDVDAWLDLLFSQAIEPMLGQQTLTFVTHYPASKAALAALDEQGMAQRFELYIRGVEIANGFQELQGTHPQRQRLLADLDKRQQLNLPQVPMDEAFLQALDQLPFCAGVALGVERLMAVLNGYNALGDVLGFDGDEWSHITKRLE